MLRLANYLKLHLPIVIGVALVLVNSLVDQNLIHFSDQFTNVVNALLAALGLGVLHNRQKV